MAVAWGMETVLPGPLVSFDQVRTLDLALVFKAQGLVTFALRQQVVLMRVRDMAHEFGVAELTTGPHHG